jgi:hypothetical protein
MMMLLMGDTVTVSREVGEDTTWVTGRVTGLVQGNHGELKYFFIKGLDSSLWLSDGWKFQDEVEDDEDA